MILLNRNKRRLWYGVRKKESVTIYETDKDGNVVTMTMSDGNIVPVIKETKVQEYTDVTEFRGNISSKSSSDTNVAGFGIDESQYEAILTVDKESLPINETSLVWRSEPSLDSTGKVITKADYRVVAVNTLPLNHDSYALQRMA